MMVLNDFLDAVGIKASVILAGFGGALERIAFFGTGNSGVLATCFAVIGGTVTAIYLGPVAPNYLGWPASGQATSALTFLVGVFGMEICKRIAAGLGSWTPTAAGKEEKKDE